MSHAEVLDAVSVVSASDGADTQLRFNPRTPRHGAVQPPLAVQVKVSWGDNVLAVKELLPSASFVVADAGNTDEVDFVAPVECMGTGRFTLLQNIAGQCVVSIPPAASGACQRESGHRIDFEQLRVAAPFNSDGHELVLNSGDWVQLVLGGLVFEVQGIVPERRMPRTFGRDVSTIAAYFGASLLSAAGLMASLAYFVPPLGVNDGEGVDADQLYLIQQYLDASAMRELEQQPETASAEEAPAGGKEGSRAAGDEGAMGKPEAAKSQNKAAFKGPIDNPNPEPMRLSEAVSFGMIGLLAGGTLQQDGVNSPWARDEALGSDPLSANGAMWGDSLGENYGNNGLGLLGAAEGGGGHSQWIGLGNVGTLGTLGNCVGAECMGMGYGRSVGGSTGSYRTKKVGMRMATPMISGRLPPQVIQRIVRQNFGRFRQCYERGLTRNPNLEGRVSVRFLIGSGGSVQTVANGGSSLPDQTVVSCVVSAFYGLSFPKPEHGSVSVTYPIMFSPG